MSLPTPPPGRRPSLMLSAQVHEFLEAYKSYRPRMWVEAPEMMKTKGLLGKMVMTYNVVVEGGHIVFNKGGARKRYSEFEALRLALEKRYGPDGLLIPPLPPKKLILSSGGPAVDGEFVKSRMKGLSLFVEALASNPFLMSDAALEKFLSSGEAPDASSDGGQSASTDGMNMGYERWIQQLEVWPLPPDADAQISKVRSELDLVDKTLREALEATKALGSGMAHLARGFGSFATAMTLMADGEAAVETLNEVQSEPTNITVPHLASRSAAFASASVRGHSASGEQLELLFNEVLEYEIAQMAGLRSLLRAREDMSAAMFKSQKRLYTLQTAPPDKLDRKARLEVEQLQAKLAKDEAQLARCTKGLVLFTVPHVARERTSNLNRAFAALAAVAASQASSAYCASIRLMDQLHMDPSQIVSSANEQASRLGLPPVEPIIVLAGAPSGAGVGPKTMSESLFYSARLPPDSTRPPDSASGGKA